MNDHFNKRHLIVLYEGKILILIDTKGTTYHQDYILDWYAKEYAFDRSKLTAYYESVVEFIPPQS